MNSRAIVCSILLCLAGGFAGCASQPDLSWRDAARQSHPWGFYTGEPVTQWNPDGRSMTLMREFRYTDPNGVVWTAPAGAVVDGASIPKPLWSFMGGPFEGKYRNASVLHDVSYDRRNRSPEDCDRMFYNAMRCSGVSELEAKTMYYALLRFGWHWKFPTKRAQAVKIARKLIARAQPEVRVATPATKSDIDAARNWIRESGPSVEDIEQRAARGME